MKMSARLSWSALVMLGPVALPLLCLSGCSAGSDPTASAQAANEKSNKENTTSEIPQAKTEPAAQYDAQGQLKRPQDHHEWIFVGAPVTPNDMNEGKAAFPEFHNVYIDPASFASYKQTGVFPNGTVILKELVSVGGKSMASGNGYFQGEFVSLEAMVKDKQRFPQEPGGWAFFRFGEAPHYTPTGTQMQTDSCNVCHAGANEDYVFTATYPVLRAAKAKTTAK